MSTAIKFQKHYVTNGTVKARVHYSAFKMATTGQDCVTLYAKSFDDGRKLASIIDEGFEDNSDIGSDYFEKGRVRILAGSPLYVPALLRAQGAA